MFFLRYQFLDALGLKLKDNQIFKCEGSIVFSCSHKTQSE